MTTNLPAGLMVLDQPATPYDPAEHVQKKVKAVLIAIAVLVLGFGMAAMLIPIGGAVIASGHIGLASHIKKIAHPAGGVIEDILVDNGTHVQKGQVLMRFDDRVTGADAQYSSLSVDQMLAQRARLEAERLGASTITFPKELASGDAAARQAMADETKLFQIRQAEQAGTAAQLQARIRQHRQQISGYQAQIRALEQQAVLIEPERKGVRQLWDKGLVTISRLNQLERTAVDLQGSVGALRASIAQTEARITEAQEQMIQLGATRRSQAGTDLAQLNAALNQQQMRSVSAMDAQDRSVVRAPYGGVVDKLAFNTIGGVVKPAEVIMEIVPDSDQPLVEGAVSPADIDHVHVGQSARIRFTAFNNAASPEIRGKVTFVAADRATDPQGQVSLYPVRVEIDEAQLKKYPELKLKPGMPAELFIETGNRTMISYLTKPLRDQFARAFRDE